MKRVTFPTRRHGPVLRAVIRFADFLGSGSLSALACSVALAGLIMYLVNL